MTDLTPQQKQIIEAARDYISDPQPSSQDMVPATAFVRIVRSLLEVIDR